MRRLLFGIALLTLFALAVARPASAVPITGISADDIGTTWVIVFDGNVDGVDVSDLSATAEVTLTGFTGSSAELTVVLTNTTSGSLSSRVSAFGFLTTPNVTSGSIESGGLFDNVLLGTFPNQTLVEVCATDGNTCQGGRNGGVSTGDTGSFVMTINFGSTYDEFTIDGLAVRYQSINGWSDGSLFYGDSGTGTGTQTSVPEPTSFALLGLGLLGAAIRHRRRRV